MFILDESDREQLTWWANGSYESEVGLRSIQGRQQDALVQGVSSLGGPNRSGVLPRALSAVRRLARISERLENCTAQQKLLLSMAFRSGDVGAFRVFGQFPRAVVACLAAQRLFRESRRTVPELASPRRPEASVYVPIGIDPTFMQWLVDLSVSSTSGRKGGRVTAQRQVAAIRAACESELIDALTAFRATIRMVDLPASLSLRELAERTGLSRTAVANRVGRLGIRRFCRSDGHRVLAQDLLTKWPEAVLSNTSP